MSDTVNAKAIYDFLKPRMGARLKTWASICAHCGLCADTCHYYMADPKPELVPSHKISFLLDLLKRKGQVDQDYLGNLYKRVYLECNMCRRCSLYCPFGIEIAFMIALLRATLFSQGIAPEPLKSAIKNYQAEGNQMAVTKEDWVDTIAWCIEEIEEEFPGIEIPMDKKGAKIMYTINAREAKFYPQDIQEVAKIFHVVKEDWTMPSEKGWDDTNLAMFVGDAATSKMIVENTFKRAEELGVKQVAITE
jgi:Fe-S oxidoreductase